MVMRDVVLEHMGLMHRGDEVPTVFVASTFHKIILFSGRHVNIDKAQHK
jgi:hypothetical protein